MTYSPIFLGLEWKMHVSNLRIHHLNKEYDNTHSPSFESYLWVFKLIGIDRKKAISITLKILNPKMLFLIDFDLELNFICNQLKVPVYYCQHGVINQNHFIWSNTSNCDFSVLLWDKESGSVFDKKNKKFVVGNLFFEYLSSPASEVLRSLLYKEYDITFLRNNSKPKILVTLTWGNPDYDDFIPNEIIDSIRRNKNNYHWLIRLHPCIWMDTSKLNFFKKEFDNIFHTEDKDKIEWENSSKLPLPLLLEFIDYHVTIESSVIIDAAKLQIPSFALNHKLILKSKTGFSQPPFGGENYFLKERKNDMLHILNSDFQSIEEWLDNVPKLKSQKDTIDETDISTEFKLFLESVENIVNNG